MDAKTISEVMRAMGRKGGKLSGTAQMEKLTPEQRSGIARKAAAASAKVRFTNALIKDSNQLVHELDSEIECLEDRVSPFFQRVAKTYERLNLLFQRAKKDSAFRLKWQKTEVNRRTGDFLMEKLWEIREELNQERRQQAAKKRATVKTKRGKSSDLVTNSISAGATFIAAVAAWASWKSAKAAALSTEMQRPRPVLVIEWTCPNKLGGPLGLKNEFSVTNIGSSPAFNVQVEPVYLPGGNEQAGRALRTRLIWVIPVGRTEPSTQSFDEVSQIYGPAPRFAEELARNVGLNSPPAVAQFLLRYVALDGRNFKVECKVVSDPIGHTGVFPVHSWLGAEEKV